MSHFVPLFCNIGIFHSIYKNDNNGTLRVRTVRARIRSVKSIIYTDTAKPQGIYREWYGQSVEPPYEYSFRLTEKELIFSASRQAPALIHPDGACGAFQAELWKYDAAEFFISTPDGSRYLEFNLSPSGAWWAAVFCAPRQIAQGFESWIPTGVQATGSNSSNGWNCQATIPLSIFKAAGITPTDCKLTAAAILNSPDQIFLTTALPCDTQPDFHRPDLWENAIVL